MSHEVSIPAVPPVMEVAEAQSEPVEYTTSADVERHPSVVVARFISGKREAWEVEVAKKAAAVGVLEACSVEVPVPLATTTPI